uniref:Plastid light harvesting protein n=1 Tax=Ditylum brightwellii TaxID=49249 RepID=A0A6V2DA44_9STRA|mmetsp:Transcript_10476/g.15519  ORF Transcript_10476/g.15519 Transcript_10476/m.15519 type:complete len:246 (-) Transcript_10476:273-1010(-)
MKLAILSATMGAACAFAPTSSIGASPSLRMSENEVSEVEAPLAVVEEQEIVTEAAAPAVVALNGWVPDASLPLYGLPGATAPFGFFDPLGFSKGLELTGAKRMREAEIMHGRVAMMATIGYLIGESTPTMTYGMNVHHTIANNQLAEIPGTILFPFFLAINITEALRASIGWVEPGLGPLFTLRESYYPGDIRFDPFGFRPKDAKGYENMQNKELNNGRLAMIAAAGMCVQEQINGKGILENLGF